MHVTTLNSATTVPGGSLLSLDHDQSVAREGLLIPVDVKDLTKATAALAAAKQNVATLKKASATAKELDTANAKVAAARVTLGKQRGIWKAKVPIFFVGGEVIGFEGNPGAPEVREALGMSDETPPASAEALAAARAEGVAAGRAALLDEVAAYNTALDAVDQAQDAEAAAADALAAETDASKKPALEKALDRAKAAVKAADEAAAALKPAA